MPLVDGIGGNIHPFNMKKPCGGRPQGFLTASGAGVYRFLTSSIKSPISAISMAGLSAWGIIVKVGIPEGPKKNLHIAPSSLKGKRNHKVESMKHVASGLSPCGTVSAGLRGGREFSA